MKTILYNTLALILILTTSCKSIEKLVDQGKYDEAIVLATKKLAGKKNKKTKHIRALEKAFAKVNDRDLKHISYLKSRNTGLSWAEIYEYALRINSRQEKILPFLPLISKENYEGHFDFINSVSLLEEAGTKAAEHAYLTGSNLLERSKLNNNKAIAQEAHYILSSIRRFKDSYKNTADLIHEAHELGTYHILIKWDLPPRISGREDILTRKFIHQLDQNWIKYHSAFNSELVFDAISTLSINEIDISPEREVVNHFTESKILEKWVDKTDPGGNVVKDSSGTVITYKIEEHIEATVSEYLRTKGAVFSGSVDIVNFGNGSLISHETFNHVISFESDACTIVGDRRAITDRFRKRIDNTLLPFPTDYDMVDDGLDKMSEDFMYHLEKLNSADLFTMDLALK